MLSESKLDLEVFGVVNDGHTIPTARGESFTIMREFHKIYFSGTLIQFENSLQRKLCPITHVIGEQGWRG